MGSTKDCKPLGALSGFLRYALPTERKIQKYQDNAEKHGSNIFGNGKIKWF